MASIRLAAVVAFISGILSGNPELLLGLIPYLPEGPYRVIAAVAVSVIVFVIPTMARLIRKEPCPPVELKPDAS